MKYRVASMPISSKDLEAYLKLRKQGEPITVRGFQRLMGYKSPGQAERVLRRLERLGLAEKTPLGYVAKRELPPELSSYLVIKGVILPRSLIFSVYATATVAVYAVLARPNLSLLTLLIAIVTPYWIEVAEQVRMAGKVLKS